METESLIKYYGGLVVVDGLPLRIPRSQMLGLLGPNGSGKATMTNCILQLLIYDRGAIRVFDQPMMLVAYELRRHIGMVPRDVMVFDELIVAENTNTFCTLYMRDRATRCRLVDEAITFVGLKKFMRFKPEKLSGSLLRRLNIACGITHGPDLIILDESTVTIDPQNRNVILDDITRLNEQDAIIICTNHYMEEVEQLCHRIVIMDRDRQAASGTSDELKVVIGTGERIRVEVVSPVPLSEGALESLRRLEYVRTAIHREPEVFVECSPGAHNLPDIMGALAAAGTTCDRVTSEPSALNDVFLEITGRTLRGEAV